MLFTINPHPHPTNDNMNVESFLPIPIQKSDPRQEEIDVVYVTNDVLPRSDDDSEEEVDAVDVLRIQAEIDECFAYAYALKDRRIDARVVVEAVDRDEIKMGARGPVEVKVERITHPAMPEDIPVPA
nr:hypothetical protein [Tanacetum cinerariifolium]